jgi:hypothetical protein
MAGNEATCKNGAEGFAMFVVQKIDQEAEYLTEILGEAEQQRAEFAHLMAGLLPDDPDDAADILAKAAYFYSLRRH